MEDVEVEFGKNLRIDIMSHLQIYRPEVNAFKNDDVKVYKLLDAECKLIGSHEPP